MDPETLEDCQLVLLPFDVKVVYEEQSLDNLRNLSQVEYVVRLGGCRKECLYCLLIAFDCEVGDRDNLRLPAGMVLGHTPLKDFCKDAFHSRT